MFFVFFGFLIKTKMLGDEWCLCSLRFQIQFKHCCYYLRFLRKTCTKTHRSGYACKYISGESFIKRYSLCPCFQKHAPLKFRKT